MDDLCICNNSGTYGISTTKEKRNSLYKMNELQRQSGKPWSRKYAHAICKVLHAYSAVPTSILNYIIVSYAISFLQFGRSFLDRMRLFYVTFKMFLNNLTHYKFNKVEPKKRIGRKKNNILLLSWSLPHPYSKS